MGVIRWELKGCLLALALAGGRAMAADCDPAIGSLASVQGETEVQSGATGARRSAALEELLCPGDVIRVGHYGRAEASIVNQPNVRLDQNTALELPSEELPSEDKPWLIRLLSGTAYFFSRRPRALSVDTPFVTAAVEGTEFLVRVEHDRTLIIVFEGRIIASNAQGQLQLASGQSAVAEAGQAPRPFLLVRPTDAVQWAIYYPQILPAIADPSGGAAQELPEPIRGAVQLAARGELRVALARFEAIPEAQRAGQFFLYRAAAVLSVGRVEEARANINEALARDPDNGLAHALNAVIALAQNEKELAIAEARRAVDLRPREAAAKIALSYAEQGRFRLDAAREALEQAVKDEPRNALAWARLAELWLMLGYRGRAREAAETAAALAPQLERIQTVLGFAALAEFRATTAKRAFERAIALNSVNPLPRFGLGLAKIRQGSLEEGRRDIEVAVALDPNSSLLRSYLGKAYFEERTTDPLAYFRQLFEDFPNQENTLAAEQFAIAKELDPLDPTPYFYDAIRKQSENRPVEALRDAETAIRLNENRAVYRSRELLDQDRAARGASLGRIYTDLGFEQLGINEATKSLTLDPASPSAHRFLSDLYAAQPRREVARVSELLQAQLLQDININPVQPSLSETNLGIITSGGPARPGFNEFTPLFERNQVQLNLTGEVGSNDTFANEAVISGLYNRFSLSAGQFHYETDGFRENNDLRHNIYNLFAQAAVTPEVNVQAEFLQRSSEHGDRRLLFGSERFIPSLRRDDDAMTARAGLRISPSPRSDIIASLIYNKRDENRRLSPTSTTSSAQDAIQGEARYLFRSKRMNFTTGFSLSTIDEQDQKIGKKDTAYIYSDLGWPESFTWTVGLSVDDYQDRSYNISKLNPKFGLQWQIKDNIRVRFAAFKALKPQVINNRTIEPTQIAGFSQFLDDFPGTVSWSYGAGLDARLTNNFYGGIEITRRDLEAPVFSGNRFFKSKIDEQLYLAYLFWTLGREWAISTEVKLDFYERGFLGSGPTQVETISVPLSLSYFHLSGFLAVFGVTYVHQHVEVPQVGTQPLPQGEEGFVVVNASVGYRFPQRRGLVSLEVRNLFNTDFRYRDNGFRQVNQYEPGFSPFIPDRMVLARLTLNF